MQLCMVDANHSFLPQSFEQTNTLLQATGHQACSAAGNCLDSAFGPRPYGKMISVEKALKRYGLCDKIIAGEYILKKYRKVFFFAIK